MGAQGRAWYWDLLRGVVAGIDMGVYWLARAVIQVIFDISNLTASPKLVDGVYSRIYVLLGVFMLFKLSFSFFTYIVDPDSMADKSKGVGKLITNTVVMLLMLVGLPSILFGSFQGNSDNAPSGLLVRAQNALLPMLPRVLLGVKDNTGAASGNAEKIAAAADLMAVAALKPFYSPVPNLSAYCNTKLPKAPDGEPITALKQLWDTKNLYCENTNEGGPFTHPQWYVYTYIPIISTVVGLLLVVLLLAIALDVAKRVFKLIILQMIAPIPIMSYIDPKSSKDGAFAAWLKLLTSTFLDIFFKLGIVYVVLMFIEQIITGGLWANMPDSPNIVRWLFVELFMIFGLLLFAKEAPKFIKDALGIKDNPGSGGMLGKIAGTMAGGAVGAAGGLMGGRGLAGAMSGLATGAKAGYDAAGTGKPANAWAASRDAAGAKRTGDKDYKGGMMNAFAKGMDKMHGNSQAKKLNLSDARVNQLDKDAEAAEASAAAAADRYTEAVQRGANQSELASLSDAKFTTQTAAAKARKNADFAKQQRELRVGPDDARTKISGLSTSSEIAAQRRASFETPAAISQSSELGTAQATASLSNNIAADGTVNYKGLRSEMNAADELLKDPNLTADDRAYLEADREVNRSTMYGAMGNNDKNPNP